MLHLKDVLIELTKKELKVRYNNNILGYFWSITNPLMHTLVYWVVFGLIMKSKVENFPLFLITAMFPWQWIANSIGVGPMTFLGNASLIKKVKFPRHLISLVAVFQDLIHFWASIPIIIVCLYVYGLSIHWTWFIGIPLLSLIQLAITYSLNLVIASVNLFFRDMEKLIQIFMMFLFYFTPILYDVSQIPEKYQKLVFFHPVAPLMIAWRSLFMNGELNWICIGQSFLVASLFLTFAHLIFRKLHWRFAEIL